MTAPHPPEGFDAIWETLAAEIKTPDAPPGATIKPALSDEETGETLQWGEARASLGMATWLPTLPVATAQEVRETPFDLEIEGELGRGGMGVVLEARQRSLEREVALKRVREERLSPKAVEALLEEARITGGLEHPNIIPVHALGLDQGGLPLLVMKRVRGVAWQDMLGDPEHAAWDQISGDRVIWNIETLVRVCHAIEYAHSQGILHRDIKTENVMIGAYGEVYVLDWGIALRMGTPDEGTDTSEVMGAVLGGGPVIGTPAYMAPEMTRGGPFTARTDVYLMGATLHEILVGAPRHAGRSIYEVMCKAYNSEPFDYGDAIPEELAAICNTATAAAPKDRYDTARDFRLALMDFLQHRASIELSDVAEARLVDLEAHLERDGEGPELQQLFTECRFGFRQAIEGWPENPSASEGLDRCLEWMLDHEIAQGNVRVAQSLLSELGGADRPELAARVEALRAQQEADKARRAELDALAHGMDRTVSSFQRGLSLMVLTILSSGVSLGILFMVYGLGIEPTHSIGMPAIWTTATVVIGLIWLGRRSLMRNKINRQLSLGFGLCAISLAVLRTAAWRVGVPVKSALVLESVVISLTIGLFAIGFDGRLWKPAVASAICTGLAMAFPDIGMEIYCVEVFVVIFWIGLIWLRGGASQRLSTPPPSKPTKDGA